MENRVQFDVWCAESCGQGSGYSRLSGTGYTDDGHATHDKEMYA